MEYGFYALMTPNWRKPAGLAMSGACLCHSKALALHIRRIVANMPELTKTRSGRQVSDEQRTNAEATAAQKPDQSAAADENALYSFSGVLSLVLFCTGKKEHTNNAYAKI